jgi:hypothetical protein
VIDVLSQLTRDFTFARNEALADARYPAAGECPVDRCRYCGERWILWAGSKLDGHAKCLVPDSFKTSVRDAMAKQPALTFHAVAAALGVTDAVVRAWIAPTRSEGR